MIRKKILSSILAGTLLGLAVIFPVKAMNVKSNSGYECTISDEEINNLKASDGIEILGKKYDLSNVNPSVLKVVAKEISRINSGNLSESDKTRALTDIKNILDDYEKDPKKYENYPETLEYGPATLLRQDIYYVQTKISDLKQEQETLKKTKMAEEEINKRVKELQDKIDKLGGWINYSVANFSEDSYKQMFCDMELIEENSTNQDVKEVESLITAVYATNSYNKIFKVSVNSDGTYSVDGNVEVSAGELSEIIEKNLEFENLKVRNLLEEIKAVENSKIAEIEQEKQIKQLKREIESVKAYGLSQEIILLNLERDALEKTKISIEFMEERLNEIDKKISEKLESLKDFKLNFENNPEYVVKNSDLGKTPSYFGYVLQDENGFGVKVSLDENNKVLIDNIKLAGVENVTLDVLTSEQKITLKKVVEEKISKSKDEINKLQNLKFQFESKSDDDRKYYLTDSVDKQLSVLNNDIKNYEIILSQI